MCYIPEKTKDDLESKYGSLVGSEASISVRSIGSWAVTEPGSVRRVEGRTPRGQLLSHTPF